MACFDPLRGLGDVSATRGRYDDGAVEIADQVFLVRMWFEASGVQPGAWRGMITHVVSNERWYFSELSELNDFIRLRLDASQHSTAEEICSEV